MFRATGSTLDWKRTRRRHVLNKEKLEEISSKLGDIFGSIFVPNFTADRHVFIISTM
jgi:hypothetical protein